jgi:hypothetical protein
MINRLLLPVGFCTWLHIGQTPLLPNNNMLCNFDLIQHAGDDLPTLPVAWWLNASH